MTAASPAEHARTVAMLNHVFTFDPPLTAADLAWYYDQNPVATASVGRVEEDGKRLGNYALIPLRLGRGDGHEITLGVGVDLAVDPDARGKGTFRATVEDSYARGSADGLDGILGVANANSAPRMVSALGWRGLPDLPARLLLPGIGRGRFTTTVAGPAYLGSAAFAAATADGFAPQGAEGYAPVWTADVLRWRLAKRRARYWVHESADLLAVSTVTKVKGVPFAVLLKTLPRRRDARLDGGALVRRLQRTHRTPFVIHWGRAPQVRLRGVTLPRRVLPSPLALVLHPFTDRFDRDSFALDAFEFLDFDAYSSLVRGPHRSRVALVKLSTVGLLVVVAWVSARLAERRTGWSDEDADGMLDGFANGGYDWVDVNGEHFGRYALALGTPIVLAACVGCLLLARRASRT